MRPLSRLMGARLHVSSYEFEDFKLNIRRYELRRSGRVLKLEKIPMELLILLLSRNGDLVSREEIVERLWGSEVFVETEHGINTAVRKIRQALGDDSENPKFVKTLKGKGYRFDAPILARSDQIAVLDSSEQLSALSVPTEKKGVDAANGQLIGRKISHYRILDVLGAGGMGIVYRAEDVKLGRRVALKFLPEEMTNDLKALKHFQGEALAISALDHPNVCTIHEVEEHQGRPFLVMPLLEGQTLRERLESRFSQKTPYVSEELLDIALQIVSGLEAAHHKGMIHRDIKPANIFLTNRGEVKILDFGLAKFIGSSEPSVEAASPQDSPNGSALPEPAKPLTVTVSRTGRTMGTPAYLSPEQVQGEKLDARTDVYSVGLILYEMATGQRVIAEDTVPKVHQAILQASPKSVRELNPEISLDFERIILRAIKKDRHARYLDASQMREDLLRLKGSASASLSGRWTKIAAVAIFVVFVTVGLREIAVRKSSAPGPESVLIANGLGTTTLLVKGPGPKVFLIVDGRRRWIPDQRTLDSLGLGRFTVKTITDKQLEDIPQGENYPSLTGRVVKGNGPELHLLEQGKRRLILDKEMLATHGLGPTDIQSISDDALRLIPKAATISLATTAESLAREAKGTYLDSCRDSVTHGNVLTAVCQKLDGSWQTATIEAFNRCAGDIWNVDGYLSCELAPSSAELPDPDLDPKQFYTHLTHAEGLERNGKYEAAIIEYKQAIAVATPIEGVCGRLWTAHAFANLGDRLTAKNIIGEEIARSSPRRPSSYCMAQAYAGLDPDEAIKWLGRAQQEQDPRMRFVGSDWRLASLRAKTGFQQLAPQNGTSQ